MNWSGWLVSEGMADLHSHLLPGVDDGSKTPDQSAQVLRNMASENVTAVCLTPHLEVADLNPSRLEEKLELHANARARLAPLAPQTPKRHSGVELMLNERLASEAVIDRRITLAGSRYILVEFPSQLNAESVRSLVGLVVDRGFVPVIAHPERYSCGSTASVFSWRERGAAVQVDATTLASGKGSRAKRAREIVEGGLADILAADNHGDARTLRSALLYLVGIGADDAAEYLLSVNPLAIVRDEALESVPSIRKRRRIRRLLSRFFR